MKYPNNLRNVRENFKNRHGYALSGVKVANEIGISPQYYYDLETGRKRLNSDLLPRLASVLDVSTDEILTDIKTINPDTLLTKQKKPKDLMKILEQEDLTLDGEPITEEGIAKIKAAIELAYWDAKQKNKRKKPN
jgi:transcriptional regulator with XRE-family HTH domain